MYDTRSCRSVLSSVVYIFALLISLISRNTVFCVSKHPIVFIISVDAFRFDYVEDCLTPTINTLRQKGVYAPYMRNVFPTKTFPNHHSIATGLYPEVHGVLDSEVYISKDGCSNRSVVGYSYELFHYNNDILPIWTLNQVAGQGRHSGVMMWPGGEYPYGCKKTLPTFHQKLDLNISFEQRVNTIMSWLTHPDTPANLVLLYLEEPDLHGHAFGINSIEVREQIKKVDHTLQYIYQKLQDLKLQDAVNVFVLSDHGMVSLDQRKIVDLNKFVDNSTYVAASLSPALQIFPKLGYEDAVHLALQEARQKNKNAFDVFLKEEIPDMWHYRHNDRTPPILVVAKEGYAFQDMFDSINQLNKQFNIEPNPRNKYGIHGYSNDLQSMFPIFFAWGPTLNIGTKLEPFNSVDLYPTWAFFLNLQLEDFNYTMPLMSILSSVRANATRTSSLEPTQVPPITIESAAKWTYWVAGILAFALVMAILGVITHYFREIRYRNGLDNNLHSLSERAEAQGLMTSDSED